MKKFFLLSFILFFLLVAALVTFFHLNYAALPDNYDYPAREKYVWMIKNRNEPIGELASLKDRFKPWTKEQINLGKRLKNQYGLSGDYLNLFMEKKIPRKSSIKKFIDAHRAEVGEISKHISHIQDNINVINEYFRNPINYSCGLKLDPPFENRCDYFMEEISEIWGIVRISLLYYGLAGNIDYFKNLLNQLKEIDHSLLQNGSSYRDRIILSRLRKSYVFTLGALVLSPTIPGAIRIEAFNQLKGFDFNKGQSMIHALAAEYVKRAEILIYTYKNYVESPPKKNLQLLPAEYNFCPQDSPCELAAQIMFYTGVGKFLYLLPETLNLNFKVYESMKKELMSYEQNGDGVGEPFNPVETKKLIEHYNIKDKPTLDNPLGRHLLWVITADEQKYLNLWYLESGHLKGFQSFVSGVVTR